VINLPVVLYRAESTQLVVHVQSHSNEISLRRGRLKFPRLASERLNIDEIRLADKESIFEIFSNEDVIKYYDLEALKDLAQSVKLIKFFRLRFDESRGIRWAIRLKSNGKCIGTCGFNSWSEASRSAIIGYDMNREYWGQGLVTEALYQIIDMAFSGHLPCKIINRIQADTIPGNIASERVLKKLGFKEEGVRRQSGYWKNAYHDLKCFGLLKDEFVHEI